MGSIPVSDEKHKEFKTFLLNELDDANQKDAADELVDRVVNGDIELTEGDLQ